MSLVWDDTKFKGTELLCLLTLADHANDDGVCWPSYDRIARRARCSRRQAMRCVEHLKSEGWITVIGKKPTDKGQFVNLYRIHLKGGDMASPAKGKGGDKNWVGGDKNGKKVVTPMSPKSSGESPIEQGPWGLLPNPGNLTIEDAHAHLIATTTLNEIEAVRCCHRWGSSAKSLENWKESLSSFAEGFQP